MSDSEESKAEAGGHTEDSKAEVGRKWSQTPPRLPTFSGEEKDSPFDLWHYEVQCLEAEERAEADIRLAIRRSLKGQASRTLMSLGIGASVDEILTKFKAVFGPTVSGQTIMSTFYSLKQREGEDAGTFANRLEDCLYQVIQCGKVERSASNTMLKEAFEAGLRTQTRLAVGFLFRLHTLKFEELVLEVKRTERELKLTPSATVHSVQESQIQQLISQVAQLRTELQTLKQSQSVPTPPAQPRQPRTSQGSRGQRYAPAQAAYPTPNRTVPSYAPRGNMHQGYGYGQSGPHAYPGQGAAAPPQPPRRQDGPITCWKCGNLGHVAKGCRSTPVAPAHLNYCLPVAKANPQANQPHPWWDGQRW